MRHVLATRAVAALAADVPLRHLPAMNVIADGMATVAGRPGGALHVVRRIEGGPPVSALVGYVIRTPGVIGEDPLHSQREVIVADLGEVALLPQTAIYESHLIFREFRHIVRGQVGRDGFGMFVRISYDVRHRRRLPARVDFLMALLAGL